MTSRSQNLRVDIRADVGELCVALHEFKVVYNRADQATREIIYGMLPPAASALAAVSSLTPPVRSGDRLTVFMGPSPALERALEILYERAPLRGVIWPAASTPGEEEEEANP